MIALIFTPSTVKHNDSLPFFPVAASVLTDSSGKISRVPRGQGLKNVGLAAGAIGVGISVAYAFGDKLMSRKEDLATDVQDLYNTLQKVSSESPSAKNALMKLYPFAAFVKTMNISTQDGFQKFVTEYNKFKSIIYPQVKSDVVEPTPRLLTTGGD